MTPAEQIAMTAPVVMTCEKIDMTTPVVTASKTMSFILPSKYIEASMEPPKPLDPRIKLEKVPGHIALLRRACTRLPPTAELVWPFYICNRHIFFKSLESFLQSLDKLCI
mmetsp:Transcript_6959/g.7888  ORF Transcript_6959/g.7888 Transcript_6959/m.7888 type:complete len:110 (-) Transcript_6959:118-447(-)